MKQFKIEVVYSIEYFQRDLFLIKINNKLTTVYRSSGLNPGREGRFLPFLFLNIEIRGFSSYQLGYIFKEFYFDNRIIPHYKQPQNLNDKITDLLIHIENELSDIRPENSNFSMDDIKEIAVSINKDIEEHGFKLDDQSNWFDWNIK